MADEPRRGRVPTITDEQVGNVAVDTLEELRMTRPIGPRHPWRRISTLSRMWPIRSNCPHGPSFIEKIHDAVGLHLNPPEHAVVLRMDKNSQVPGYPGNEHEVPRRPSPTSSQATLAPSQNSLAACSTRSAWTKRSGGV